MRTVHCCGKDISDYNMHFVSLLSSKRSRKSMRHSQAVSLRTLLSEHAFLICLFCQIFSRVEVPPGKLFL